MGRNTRDWNWRGCITDNWIISSALISIAFKIIFSDATSLFLQIKMRIEWKLKVGSWNFLSTYDNDAEKDDRDLTSILIDFVLPLHKSFGISGSPIN